MVDTARLAFHNRNPDVLTCIANLSNDEVFTPPEFANQMLDTVADAWAIANDGANIWADRTVKFLDPFTKSGVFLREIVSRLTTGLEREIPNLQERVDHILKHQVFGIGITRLTSLMARRSVYCSKWADGEHSIGTLFDNDRGNIWFESLAHTWEGGRERILTADKRGNPIEVTMGGKCKYCGANQKNYERAAALETHAYAFIHTDDASTTLARIFGEEMQFDVIVGNPPYQLDDGGYGTSAAPIYNKFVEQAKALDPRLLSMVIPARWFAGGKGLDDFRASMLNDDRIRVMKDYPDSSQVFPGVQIKGGICYFLWDRDNPGECSVTSHSKGGTGTTLMRPLLESGADVFIRYNEALPILKKVISTETGGSARAATLSLPEDLRFDALISSRKPFGLDTTFRGRRSPAEGDVVVYEKGGVGHVARSEVTKARDIIDAWKVFIPTAGSGSDAFPHPILGKPFAGEPGSVSSETYLYIGPFGNERETRNVISYISTRLFRFLVLMHKPSQHATRSVYKFVPTQDFSRSWSDRELYERYGITDDEVAFIETLIRPMELTDD